MEMARGGQDTRRFLVGLPGSTRVFRQEIASFYYLKIVVELGDVPERVTKKSEISGRSYLNLTSKRVTKSTISPTIAKTAPGGPSVNWLSSPSVLTTHVVPPATPR